MANCGFATCLLSPDWCVTVGGAAADTRLTLFVYATPSVRVCVLVNQCVEKLSKQTPPPPLPPPVLPPVSHIILLLLSSPELFCLDFGLSPGWLVDLSCVGHVSIHHCVSLVLPLCLCLWCLVSGFTLW